MDHTASPSPRFSFTGALSALGTRLARTRSRDTDGTLANAASDSDARSISTFGSANGELCVYIVLQGLFGSDGGGRKTGGYER